MIFGIPIFCEAFLKKDTAFFKDREQEKERERIYHSFFYFSIFFSFPCCSLVWNSMERLPWFSVAFFLLPHTLRTVHYITYIHTLHYITLQQLHTTGSGGKKRDLCYRASWLLLCLFIRALVSPPSHNKNSCFPLAAGSLYILCVLC